MIKLSPRRVRVLKCLLERPHSTTELEYKCYIRYSPDVIKKMSDAYGLYFHCEMVKHTTIDGIKTRYGIYSILDCSREKAQRLVDAAATTSTGVISNLAKQTNNSEDYNMVRD